jgi:hypothetical protein
LTRLKTHEILSLLASLVHASPGKEIHYDVLVKTWASLDFKINFFISSWPTVSFSTSILFRGILSEPLSDLSYINPLKTKRTPLYLKTQFVPRCKHFSSWLYKPISLCCKWHKSLFVLR